MDVLSIQVRGDDSVIEDDGKQGEQKADRTNPTKTPRRVYKVGFEGEQRQSQQRPAG